MKSKKVLECMEKFVEDMHQLYIDAGGLRDCTENHHEKDVFNQTRNALYELRYKAKQVLMDWKKEK